jgi:hypothetical protein
VDGLLRAIADALGGLVAGIAAAAMAAVNGVVSALTSVVPAGLLPIVAIGFIVIALVVLFRR